MDNLQRDLKTRKQSFCMRAASRAAVKGAFTIDPFFSSTTLSARSRTIGKIRSKLEKADSSSPSSSWLSASLAAAAASCSMRFSSSAAALI